MAEISPGHGSKGSTRKSAPTVITNARTSTSRELGQREKRYAITMGIRTACFVAMIFVPGPFRWVLLAGAVFLPYVAVLFANQADTKTKTVVVEGTGPSRAPQLTTGEPDGEVISGELMDDEPAPKSSFTDTGDDSDDDEWTRQERVA